MHIMHIISHKAIKIMGYIMKDICLTYLGEDIRPAKYIVSFFRIAGVYVYERIIYSNDKVKPDFPSFDMDINIIILGQNYVDELIERYGTEDTVFILMSDRKVIDKDCIIGKDKKNIGILEDLIKLLSKKYTQFDIEKNALSSLAEIFESNHLAETLLGTRYFLPDKIIYSMLCPNYEKAIEDISNKLKEDIEESIKGNFLWFAMAYIGYEYNYYCKRLKQGFLFRPDNLLEITEELREGYNGNWKSLLLLQAQIYDDLEGKVKKAYELYAETADSAYNAFAWYKMGNIWQKNYKDSAIALEHFKKAVNINPSYYRAIYKLAECEYMLENFNISETLYKRVIELLQNNYAKGILSPLDIEYLYKSNFNIARIEVTQYGDIFEAIRIYKWIEELWERILDDTSVNNICFIYIFVSEFNEKILTNLYQVLKNKLDVNNVKEERNSLESTIAVKAY